MIRSSFGAREDPIQAFVAYATAQLGSAASGGAQYAAVASCARQVRELLEESTFIYQDLASPAWPSWLGHVFLSSSSMSRISTDEQLAVKAKPYGKVLPRVAVCTATDS
mmetsp:Transcript_25436/g.51113  ORF Transcript_25436/g.51113 Transcript_25436/m.51113 type:complete len:109 (-) Transcript_25436:15-341(-)